MILERLNIYIVFAKYSFLKESVHNFNTLVSLFNAGLTVWMYIIIWTSFYENVEVVKKVDLKTTITYVVFSLLFFSIFITNEFRIEKKYRMGTIIYDLLKPVNFLYYIISLELGELLYRIATIFFPALIISIFLFDGILPPANILYLLLSLISLFFGYLVFFFLNHLFSLLVFWIYNIYSVSIIKNALISLLSGAVLPIWFMPSWIQNLVKYSPFDTFFHIPILIYMGKVNSFEIFVCFLKQILWFIILFFISQNVWNAAKKRIIIQGG